MTKMNKSQIWNAFNRMQKACMAKESIITRKDFFAEPEKDQKEYYRWMRNQVGSFTAGPIWD